MRSYRPRVLTPARLLTVVTTAALAASTIGGAASASPARPSSSASSVPVVRAAAPAAGHGGVGHWQVADRGAGRYEVRWTSPRRLPQNSDRPTITGGALPFGPSTIAADRRTVTATVTADVRPATRPTSTCCSRATGSTSAAPTSPPGSAAWPRRPRRRRPSPPRTPPSRGRSPPSSSDYDLPPVKLPGMPRPIEMVGHVVEPAADQVTGPRPLVLFLHGRHGVCYNPDDENDYDDDLALRGQVRGDPEPPRLRLRPATCWPRRATRPSRSASTASTPRTTASTTAAPTPRPRIVAEHLDHWTTIAAAHQVDLSQGRAGRPQPRRRGRRPRLDRDPAERAVQDRRPGAARADRLRLAHRAVRARP